MPQVSGQNFEPLSFYGHFNKLEVHGKPAGRRMLPPSSTHAYIYAGTDNCTHAITHAQTDGQPENLMSPVRCLWDWRRHKNILYTG